MVRHAARSPAAAAERLTVHRIIPPRMPFGKEEARSLPLDLHYPACRAMMTQERRELRMLLASDIGDEALFWKGMRR